MRSLPSSLGPSGLALAFCLAADGAQAQIDVNPPLPNVLLLIDTSGSMENMVDGRRPEEAGAACLPGTKTPMNRWATLVSVLTGTIQAFSCSSQDRSSAAFLDEYSIGGAPPADAKYHLPFHRILSNGCTHGPGALPSPWYTLSGDAIRTHAWNNRQKPCDAPGFRQDADGLLDTYRDRVRFGLMTFDSLPHPGADAEGGYSYFLGWNADGAPAHGHPAGCAEQPFEVGAKNPAAPPWEGGLIGFGGYDAPNAEVRAQNARIQSTLLALRPFGATPLAGMLADARDFLLHDTTKNPATGAPLGPADDPYAKGGCRPQFVLVLSDGEPNLDLRDACAAGDGKCPYPKPWEIAHELATAANPIPTFAIGFGLSGAGGVECASLSPADLLDPSGPCVDADGSLAACCTLARIAHEGHPSPASRPRSRRCPGKSRIACTSGTPMETSIGSTSRAPTHRNGPRASPGTPIRSPATRPRRASPSIPRPSSASIRSAAPSCFSPPVIRRRSRKAQASGRASPRSWRTPRTQAS